MSSSLININSSATKKNWYRSPKVWRQAVMAFFFVFLLHVAYDHQVKGGGPRGTPSVEAYCPFGGVESLYQFLTTGGFIRRVEPSSLILLGALVVLTLFFSRGFCGWICPFGSVQEWIGMLGSKIFGKRYNPTGAWDRALRYLKYVILVVIIALTWHLGTMVFRDYDPFLAFFHLGKGIDELPWAYSMLGVMLVGSLYIERFFCKYACPLGAVLGILGKVGLTKIERDPEDCKGCNICQKKCHAHVDFLSVTTIRDSECNHCMDCVVDCPKPNVLSARGPRWRFSHSMYAALLVVGLFAFIGASQLAGKWQTKPAMVSFTGASGKLDVENIRGWMTLGEISSGYGIPTRELYSRCGLPERVPSAARLNTVAKTYNLKFDPDQVREVVRGYLAGAPAAPVAPKAVAQKEQVAATQKAGKKDHPAGSAEEDVKGFMTLNEIALKSGVPKEYLLKSLNVSDGVDARQPVREWMHAQDKSIQDLRDAVKAYRSGAR